MVREVLLDRITLEVGLNKGRESTQNPRESMHKYKSLGVRTCLIYLGYSKGAGGGLAGDWW